MSASDSLDLGANNHDQIVSLEKAPCWVKSCGMNVEPDDVKLTVIGPDKFQLLEPFALLTESGCFDVPTHNPADPNDNTDLASVPPFLWGLLASYGHQLRAALLHDHLCDQADEAFRAAVGARDSAGRRAAYMKRVRADDLFRTALEASQVPIGRRWIFWCGVAFGRLLSYKPALATLLAGQVLFFVPGALVGVIILVAGYAVTSICLFSIAAVSGLCASLWPEFGHFISG